MVDLLRRLRRKLRLRTVQREGDWSGSEHPIDNVDAGSAGAFLDYDPSSQGGASFPPGYLKPQDDRRPR